MSKIIEWMKKDKLTASWILGGSLVFIVGIFIIIADTNNTYAISTDDFGCANSTYDVVVYDGSFYCCPAGWSFFPSEKGCYIYTDAWSAVDNDKICEGYGAIGEFAEGNKKYFCKKSSDSVLEKYTVTYNANEGTNAPSSEQVLSGNTIKISFNEPNRAGYKFLGWSINESNNTVVINRGMT